MRISTNLVLIPVIILYSGSLLAQSSYEDQLKMTSKTAQAAALNLRDYVRNSEPELMDLRLISIQKEPKKSLQKLENYLSTVDRLFRSFVEAQLEVADVQDANLNNIFGREVVNHSELNTLRINLAFRMSAHGETSSIGPVGVLEDVEKSTTPINLRALGHTLGRDSQHFVREFADDEAQAGLPLLENHLLKKIRAVLAEMDAKDTEISQLPHSNEASVAYAALREEQYSQIVVKTFGQQCQKADQEIVCSDLVDHRNWIEEALVDEIFHVAGIPAQGSSSEPSNWASDLATNLKDTDLSLPVHLRLKLDASCSNHVFSDQGQGFIRTRTDSQTWSQMFEDLEPKVITVKCQAPRFWDSSTSQGEVFSASLNKKEIWVKGVNRKDLHVLDYGVFPFDDYRSSTKF